MPRRPRCARSTRASSPRSPARSVATPEAPRAVGEPGDTAGVIDRNVEALIKRRQQERAETTREDKVADAITQFAGSMKFVYLHLVIYGTWIVINLGWVPMVPKFDPTFVALAMVASVEAIFISTFVMISQNRMAKVADQRADLDLQISLLAEHEITRILTLVTEVAKRMEVREAEDPELDELARDVAPEHVLDRMQETERKLGEQDDAA
ncbi:DUF1003 domain-containing protein [Schlegelella sp. ID0723]|uniref:DUF1003 domain-containing protein n=1 Tax=Piscinibacter koreensis TaxID=2742824 RepID=A0A7Y6NLU1_9BURK|nr:DUF1003 domain-containing protein [Schlegelella koreensis]